MENIYYIYRKADRALAFQVTILFRHVAITTCRMSQLLSHFEKEKGVKKVFSSVQTCALRGVRIINCIYLFIYLLLC